VAAGNENCRHLCRQNGRPSSEIMAVAAGKRQAERAGAGGGRGGRNSKIGNKRRMAVQEQA